MRRWQKWSLGIVGVTVALEVAVAGVAFVARAQAHRLVTNPIATRQIPTTTPADAHLAYEDVTVVTSDGPRLVGWFLPGSSGRVVVVLHGFRGHRGNLLDAGAAFVRHGYSVLLPTLRAHDLSEGDTLTFGVNEVKDLDAWFEWLHERPDVDVGHLGFYGASMGGAIGIDYTATHPEIRALAVDSAFSSINDTIATSVRRFTGLPPFPFAPLILYFMSQETGVPLSQIDAKKTIGKISPRPVFIMQGGADTTVSPESGERLYQAAGEPKELWFEPSLRHAEFRRRLTEEWDRRVVAFFDKYLKE